MSLYIAKILVLAACMSAAPDEVELPSWIGQTAIPQEVVRAQVEAFLVARIPTLSVPDTREAWLGQVKLLRQDFLDKVVLEGTPDSWTAPETQTVWGETIAKEGYTIRKLRYQAVPGLWIPAVLYEPLTDAPSIPAVLNVNGHIGPPGKAAKEEQIRCINLAKRGMLALHPEWFSFGELTSAEFDHGNIAYLDILGVRGLSLFYLALKRGLDVLDAYPRTDRDRIAMTGLSGGGWQTALLSALDERIDLIVPVAGHGGMKPRIEAVSDIGDLEQVPSDMFTVADYTHLTALFAPRPTLLIYNAKDNCCFLPERTLSTVYDPVVPVYRLFNATGAFEYYINTEPGTHNYEQDNRLRFYGYISEYFLPTSNRIEDEIACEADLFEPKDLYVGIPAGNETFVTIAEKFLQAVERPSIPPSDDPSFPAWQAHRRETLLRIVRLQRMAVSVESQKDLGTDVLYATIRNLKTADWTIPTIEVGTSKAERGTVTLVVGDQGISALSDSIRELVQANQRVLAFDPLFMGSNIPYAEKSWALAMTMNATGERAMGVQAGQIAAVAAWAREALQVDCVRVVCKGWNATVAVLVAAASGQVPFEHITVSDAPESLSEIIRARIPYSRFPALFCFGLLKHFDMADLTALCRPAQVSGFEFTR
jgi:dienelactone hydrolase